MFARSFALFTCLTLVFTVGLPHATASVYSDSVINNTGPVIYWNQDETTGSTADDLVDTVPVPPPAGVVPENDGTYWARSGHTVFRRAAGVRQATAC